MSCKHCSPFSPSGKSCEEIQAASRATAEYAHTPDNLLKGEGWTLQGTLDWIREDPELRWCCSCHYCGRVFCRLCV
jgi:hypothetical protein